MRGSCCCTERLAEVGDTDGDGLSDGAEINTYGLNAKNADSDGDGMEDGWEVANGLNPLNAADAGQDADGDGIPNGIERIIGTNPQVADPVHDVAPGEVSLKYRSQKVQGEKVGFSPFNSGVWLPTEGCEPDGESAPWPPKKYQTYEKMSISESPDGHYYSESQESVGIEGGEARWALSFNGEVYTAIPQCPSNGQTETTTTFSGDFFRTNCGSRCGLTTEITVTKVCEGNYQTNSPAVYSNDWRDIAGETLRTGGSGCDGAYTFDRRTTTWVWENVITSAYSTTTLTYDGALSDEFTTGELVDWTQGASLTLPALQTLEWGNGTTLNLTCPPANGAETATAARRDLSTDELTLSLTRIQYAGALTNSTTGVVYRATMLHLFTPEGASTSAVVYVTNLWAKGTGGAVELWPTNGVTVEPPLAEGVVGPTLIRLHISEPDGLPIQGLPTGDGITRFSPASFEWQYVHPNTVIVPYSQPIEGIIEIDLPSAGYCWSVSTGALTGADTPAPTFNAAGMALPTTMSQVTLALRPRSPLGNCVASRVIEVYRDHLERDLQNFGQKISCGGPSNLTWAFVRYGRRFVMPHSWNCFGSVWHAYDGTKDGAWNGGLPTNGMTLAVYDDVPQGTLDWSIITQDLARGDIVAFYRHDPLTNSNTMQHAHTCLGSPLEMYGANNEPAWGRISITDPTGRFQGWYGGTWRWWICSSQQYYERVNADFAMLNPDKGPVMNRVCVWRR
jgi:hypothetical protein